MDVTPILESLNEAQREAVTASADPLLVIAGAGSGKTRVLTHRIAWLIDVEGVSPQGLLAVTFTNKAAAEMRGRIESLLNMPVNHLWIGTFHGLAHRLLRRHWQEAGLPQNFQIIDSDDQLRIVKRLIKNLEFEDDSWVPREIQYFINARRTRDYVRSISMMTMTRTGVSKSLFTSSTRRFAIAVGLSTSPNCCYEHTNYGATIRNCLLTINAGSDISWSTNFRIQMPFNMPGCDYWPAKKACRFSLETMTNRFIAGAAPV